MGIWATVKKDGPALSDLGRVMEECDYFEKRVWQMAKSFKLDLWEKKLVEKELADLRELAKIKSLEKEGGLSLTFIQDKANLFQKYNAPSVSGVMAKITKKINECFNQRDTDEAKWVDLRVSLWAYQAKNYEELRQLSSLQNKARQAGANSLAQIMKEKAQELIAEENELVNMVVNMKPECYQTTGKGSSFDQDYNVLSGELQSKESLYRFEGRTNLLRAFNQYVRDCGDDAVRVRQWILDSDYYWGRGGQGAAGIPGHSPRPSLDDVTRAARESAVINGDRDGADSKEKPLLNKVTRVL